MADLVGSVPTLSRSEATTGYVTVWCYDKCHTICRCMAAKNNGYTGCKCTCHSLVLEVGDA